MHLAAQCTGPIVLSSQADINAFSCVGVFTGNITIQESISGDITDLTPLNTMTSIVGDLVIRTNTALTNLNGLSALNSISLKIRISNNTALTNVNGLSALTSVGGNVNIGGNDVLTNVDGLSGLSSVGGDLKIQNNVSIAALVDFCGVFNLLDPPSGLAGGYIVAGNGVNPLETDITDPSGPCAASTSVPTLSQWGLIILALLLLTVGIVAITRKQTVLAGLEGGTIRQNSMPFDKGLYAKVLIGIAATVVLVFAIVINSFGYELTSADMPGSLIAIPIAAYLMHLLLIHEKK